MEDKERIVLEDASDVDLIEELNDRGYLITDKEEVPDDRDIGKPIEMVVPKGAAMDNVQRLKSRLEVEFGYGVHKEYEGEGVVVYNISPAFSNNET